MITFGSLFAGVGGADLGFERAGLECRWQVEIDPQCRRVLERHWPGVTRHEDVRECGKRNLERVDVICFGFPCQDLSVAGKREGLKGGRSGLYFEAMRIVRELQPAVIVAENVPGLLSSNGGRDFGAVLNEMVQCGARDVGWRILDARYFGVAQRRRRVFLVADFRAQRAGEILFERPCGCGNPPPGREAGAAAATTVIKGAAIGRKPENGPQRGEFLSDGSTFTLNCTEVHAVAHTLRAEGHDASEDGTGRGTPLVAFNVHSANSCAKEHHAYQTEHTKSLDSTGGFASGQGGTVIAWTQRTRDGAANVEAQPGSKNQAYVAYGISSDAVDRSGEGDGSAKQRAGLGITEELSPSIRSRSNNSVGGLMGVRRLLPVECNRLQAFPDDWLDLGPPLSDSAKYRMLGNAICVNVAEWIGRRIVEAMR